MERSIVFKTRPMLVTEQRIGRSLEGYLREQYVEKGMTQREIGEALGVHESTVTRWMALLGIPARFPGPRAGKAA